MLLACCVFMTSPQDLSVVVFVRQVEGKSAVMTSPDYETNVSGFFFFSRGDFLRFLEREQRHKNP